MIPSENTENRAMPPPENRFNRSRNPPWAWLSRTLVSTIGTGTWFPNRNTTMMNSVKRILFRRSGTRNELRNAFSTFG